MRERLFSGRSIEEIIFYLLFGALLVGVLFSSPFMRYPYDIYYHLMHIDALGGAGNIPEGRFIWHYIWAKFFDLLRVGQSEIFFRAKIIHFIQTYMAIFSIYYFSNVVIRNIFLNITTITTKYLALWSVIVWLTIFATFSMHHQLVWLQWYSVTYQITLPLFWYMAALSLVLLFEESSLPKKIFFTLQILLIARFILQAHSMEFLYFLMFLGTLALVYSSKVWLLFKKHPYPSIIIALLPVLFAQFYQPEESKFFKYLTPEGFPFLAKHIVIYGEYILDGRNRASASINELMYLVWLLGFFVICVAVKDILQKRVLFINLKLFITILLTSLFVLIPIFWWSAGIFGIITNENVVHRIYYSSTIFLLLPIFVYFLVHRFFAGKRELFITNLLIVSTLSATLLYSKYGTQNAVYYQNVKSLYNSFSSEKVGFHLSGEQIALIGNELQKYESNNSAHKSNFYFSRNDIAFVLKYIYRRDVYFEEWEKRTFNPDFAAIYRAHLKKCSPKQNCILFETPAGFPPYAPYE